MIKVLKKADRTLLEMHTGMLMYGIVCQIVGCFFVENQGRYAASLWFGILFAAIGCIHMARTLDRALDYGEGAAKMIGAGYALRYLVILVVFGIIAYTDVMNTIIVFLGYMSMKATAYLNPLTHKLYNRIFHETDPVPEPLPDDQLQEADDCPREDS
ncbi:MAG: ATP synthase subunit I [Acetatifactor sp.]